MRNSAEDEISLTINSLRFYGNNLSIERMSKAKLFSDGVFFYVMNCLASVSLCYPYSERQIVVCTLTS